VVMRSCPSQTAFIRTAKPNPYRRHRRQAASLPPSHERASGHAGERDHRRSSSTGAQAASDPGPLASCLHPRCQAESLPPPSPPSCIPAAPHTSGPAGAAASDPARPECRRYAPWPNLFGPHSKQGPEMPSRDPHLVRMEKSGRCWLSFAILIA
jgi:hypothetical protein